MVDDIRSAVGARQLGLALLKGSLCFVGSILLSYNKKLQGNHYSGRTRSDASQRYGSGGLIQGKQYMLSLTWNAPQQAFDDPADFFEGKGVDAVYFPFHKANEFLGMTGLPSKSA